MRRLLRDAPRWVPAALAAVVLVRVVLVVVLVPDVQSQWFAPFLTDLVSSPTIDPWTRYLDAGGDSNSFPYGLLMVAYFSAWVAGTSWLPDPFGAQLGIALGVLALEAVLWVMVARWTRAGTGALLLVAASPIVVYASYVHGQLDLAPTVMMFGAAALLRQRRWGAAGVVAGLAVAVKFSSLLIAPLILVFLLRNARFRRGAVPFAVGMLPGLVLTALPALSPGYRSMVLFTPTSQAVVSYVIDLGPALTIVLLPVVYSAVLAVQYRLTRTNPDLTVTLIGVALTAVVLLSPASPGWYLWSVPFLAVVAAQTGSRVRLAVWGFWATATATLAVRASNARWRFDTPPAVEQRLPAVGPFVRDPGSFGPLLSTLAVVTGAIALAMVLRGARRRFDAYRLSDAPLSVAIAGDSGTGKDTLCISLSKVFGADATSLLLGDDYHLYARGAPLWKVTTHLHPAANDIAAMSQDAIRLSRGEGVRSRHYDHDRGRFTKPRVTPPRELVAINGLHALLSAEVRRTVDLTVFTEMDESLRRRLKINRDTGERGQSLDTVVGSIERRYPDRDRFITPQIPLADVVLRLEPIVPLPPEGGTEVVTIPELVLVADLRNVAFVERLQRALVSIGGTLASVRYLDEPGHVSLTVHPDSLSPEDVSAVAERLVQNPEELFVRSPEWLGGSRGVMQLIIVLAMLERRLGGLQT